MTPLPKPATGDHPLVAWLNRLRACIQERTPKRGEECAIDFAPDGFRVKPSIPDIAATAAEIGQFLVTTEFQNHIKCARATANLGADPNGKAFTEGETVRIAKAPEFRATLWDATARGGALTGKVDGYLYSYATSAPWGRRTALLVDADSFGADQISTDEEIVPPYTLTATAGTSPSKRVIYAAKVKEAPIMRVTEGAESFDVEWVDITPGRVWLPVQRKIRVCVDGQAGPWFVLFRCSGSFQEE